MVISNMANRYSFCELLKYKTGIEILAVFISNNQERSSPAPIAP